MRVGVLLDRPRPDNWRTPPRPRSEGNAVGAEKWASSANRSSCGTRTRRECNDVNNGYLSSIGIGSEVSTEKQPKIHTATMNPEIRETISFSQTTLDVLRGESKAAGGADWRQCAGAGDSLPRERSAFHLLTLASSTAARIASVSTRTARPSRPHQLKAFRRWRADSESEAPIELLLS